MDILVTVGQLLLSLSILVVLHEMGHFIPAKLFDTKVEKFYLFFDPGFSLFKVQKGETEYGIGWLPLGGYVKIAGMIDESFDKEQMAGEPQPWEFRSKPAWQRLIIMIGGVTVNLILGFFIYSMVLWTYGEKYLPTENAIYGVAVDSLGRELGIMPGDKVIAVGDRKLEKLNSGTFRTEVIIHDAREFTVERNGQKITLPISEEMAQVLSSYDYKEYRLYEARVPFVAARFAKNSHADEAGIKIGDQLIGLNGDPTPFYDVFAEKIRKTAKPNQEVQVAILRKDTLAGRADTLILPVKTNEDGILGIAPFGPDYFFEFDRIDYTLAEAIPAGVQKGWSFLTNQIRAFGQIFRGKIKAKDSLGSFISIGSMFGTTWDWERFWLMTSFLSLILAFINLLPIPALDGGHVMFLLYEVITGRKPSDKFMEYAQTVGVIILLLLMVYAIGLDISRLEFVKNLFG